MNFNNDYDMDEGMRVFAAVIWAALFTFCVVGVVCVVIWAIKVLAR